MLCIVDGNAGLRRALSTVWSKTPVQRCAVHKLRNLERKAPKHALAEVAKGAVATAGGLPRQSTQHELP